VLLGRRGERRRLDRLLACVRSGESAALVIRGEPGVGKTTLLEYLAERAAGCRVARVGGVQSEMELAFAALHQLCAPMRDRLDHLPAPQRDALGTALGLIAGDASDRFLIGVAVLSLLSEVAEERPIVCLVDDAQWLDRASAQVLAFVGRRMSAESVALVFAVRERSEELSGLPELVVGGLEEADARTLLDSALRGPLDDVVRDQIIAETGGNPLALLELSPADLAGGFGLPCTLPLSGRIEQSFRRRLESLPPDTRQLLLVAAAEPLGDPVLLWRAIERLGIGMNAAAPAVAAGLIEFGARVRFRHPLVRSAVYRGASAEQARTAHRVLAEATDPVADPDRRAWHRAHAAEGPDEEVAAELERSAGRAQARGGMAAAAAFLRRSVELTPEAARRAERALAAARAQHLAGASDAALGLLATAQAGHLDELGRARIDLLRAQIAAASNLGSEAPPLLLAAAKRLEPLDVGLARETYLDLLAAVLFAGPLARDGGVLEAGRAARAAPPPPTARRAADLLLDGLALLITDGFPSGAPILKRALTMFRRRDFPREEGLRWLFLACQTAADLWDDESWHLLSASFVQLARNVGALAVLPIALSSRVGILVYSGELATAASMITDLEEITAVTGSHMGPYAALTLAAWQGREAETRRLINANIDEITQRGEGAGVGMIHWTRAFLHNSAGRYPEALAAAKQAVQYPAPIRSVMLIELIEAAARAGETSRAAGALLELSATTQASGTEWALGIEARSRALISKPESAEPLYNEAIDRLRRTRVRAELARTHLLYGEWLRRERRRTDARRQLRTAHDMLAAMGMEALATRARRELLATGETARRRTADTSHELTAQETQVARLARDGLSNADIAARLFISPRTVEYHMRKVFTKLGINSRKQLRDGSADDALATAER
jgi:DNA-binding CsgD family transcriptional regulator